MRTMLKMISAIVLVATSSIAAGAHARDRAKDTSEILRTEAELCDAFESGNGEVLRRDMDKLFLQVSSRGETTNLDQNIAEVAHRDPAYKVFRNHDQKIRLYGDAAIVNGITTVLGRTSDGTTVAGDYAYTDTWIFEDGRWKIASSHASLLPKR